MALFKPRICTWEDISYTDATDLLESSATKETISHILSKNLPAILSPMESSDKRMLILLDLFYYVVIFARKNSFKPEQLSSLFTIIKTIHLYCISTPYDNIDKGFQLLEGFLVRHSVHRPPYSVCLYSLHEVKLVSEYILQTYFKHYKMYKYAFTKRVSLDLKINYEGIPETPVISAVPSKEKLEMIEENENTDHEGIKEQEEIVEEKEDEDILTEDQRRLKDMISQTLDDHMKKLKIAVEDELSMSDKRLTERMSAIETEFQGKKAKKKK